MCVQVCPRCAFAHDADERFARCLKCGAPLEVPAGPSPDAAEPVAGC